MKKEDRQFLDGYIMGLLSQKPIKTGLTNKEVITFLEGKEPLKMYVMLLDKKTIVIHKLTKG